MLLAASNYNPDNHTVFEVIYHHYLVQQMQEMISNLEGPSLQRHRKVD